MLKIGNYSIRKKLTWMNMLVSGAALLLACVAFLAYSVSTFREITVRNLSVQAQIIGSNSVSAIVFNDSQSAADTLSALKATPNILFAGIYTLDGQAFATYSRDPNNRIAPPSIPKGPTETHWFENGQIILVRSIVLRDKPAGIVYIQSDLQDVIALVKRYAIIAAIVLLSSLLAVRLISSTFHGVVSQPIVQLAETVQTISREKTYSIRAPLTGNHDEVSVLIQAFNEMLDRIQERDVALQTAQEQLNLSLKEVLTLNEELEARVAQRTFELETTNKELEAFTYSVAHDLRAPLRHIHGFSKLLEEEFGAQITSAAGEYLRDILEGTENMGHLIDDLLALGRVGRQEVKRETTGLNSLVEEALRDFKPDLRDREIEWQIDQLPFVDCDPGLMKQVFANLLSNAIKYTRPRKPAVIHVGQTNLDGQRAIFIRDNGVGFNAQYAGKLFGVFQRLHRKEDFEGTGVGLATAQRILHKHGGRIWAEAELDKGATFYFVTGVQENPASENETVLTMGGKS